MEDIKQELYKLCQDYLQRRIGAAQDAIEAAQHAANSETKSSSGDKYETGRAMMQLEIEKNAVQLSESMKLKHALDQVRIEVPSRSVQTGSLVITNRGVFFIAISLGRVTLHDKAYLVMSPASPLGQKMLGLVAGDSVLFKDHKYIVQELR